MYIVSTGNYCENIDRQVPALKQQVKESVGSNIRRVSRFIQLALIGAGRAAQITGDEPNIKNDCAIYLSSGRGDMEVTLEVLDTINRRGEAPRPLSFINTVSNAACFYIAQCLSLQGAASFVTNRYFSLESALYLASIDIQSRRCDSALIGAVDVVVDPPEQHRQRLALQADTALAEGSHWLQMVAEPGQREVIARLKAIEWHNDRQSAEHWLEAILAESQQESESRSNIYFAAGQYMDETEQRAWLKKSNLPSFDYLQGCGHFDSQAGRAMTAFIEQKTGQLIYLNCDPNGRYIAIQLSTD